MNLKLNYTFNIFPFIFRLEDTEEEKKIHKIKSPKCEKEFIFENKQSHVFNSGPTL